MTKTLRRDLLWIFIRLIIPYLMANDLTENSLVLQRGLGYGDENGTFLLAC